MQTTLVTAGIVCLISAIVGGGLSAFGTNVPIIPSVRRQLLLGCLGFLLLLGSVIVELMPGVKPVAAPPPSPSPTQAVAVPSPSPQPEIDAKVGCGELLRTSSGGIMAAVPFRRSCCLTPTASGRKMVVGSGGVADVFSTAAVVYDGKSLPGGRNAAIEAADPVPFYNGGWHVTKDTEQEICIEIFARTSAKETNVQFNARPSALERFRPQ